jgi:RNA polymerase sigma factor (sigma-70 family)
MEISMQTQTNTTLLLGLKDPRDESAWRQFDHRYRPLILTVARRLGLQDSDAEDAAQETITAFIESYRQEKYQKDKGKLRLWLYGIARHKIRDIIRKHTRAEKPITDKTNATRFFNQVEDTHIESAWEEEWEKAILRQALEEVRQQINPQMFESFYLYALEQWSAKRVAAHLQISEDLVYQNKRRTLVKLREIMPKMEEIW